MHANQLLSICESLTGHIRTQQVDYVKYTPAELVAQGFVDAGNGTFVHTKMAGYTFELPADTPGILVHERGIEVGTIEPRCCENLDQVYKYYLNK